MKVVVFVPPVNLINFLSPSIEINKDNLLAKLNIEDIITNKLTNSNMACSKYGYYKDKIIRKTYFKILVIFQFQILFLLISKF